VEEEENPEEKYDRVFKGNAPTELKSGGYGDLLAEIRQGKVKLKEAKKIEKDKSVLEIPSNTNYKEDAWDKMQKETLRWQKIKHPKKFIGSNGG